MFNTGEINSTLRDVLLWAFIVLALFVIIKGRKGRVSDAGSMVLIGLFAVVVASLGVLVGTDFGQSVVRSIFNVG